MKTRTTQRGFTLIEMLVVIAIIGLLAALAVPAINNIKKGDVMVAATRQMLDDVGRARQLAISRHTTVYMMFVPQDFFNDNGYKGLNPATLKNPGTNLYDKQFTAYTFVTMRRVGDQPGVVSPDYIGPWHTLPEGSIIPTNKFVPAVPGPGYYTITDPPGSTTPNRSFLIYPFSYTNSLPFPSEDAYDLKSVQVQTFASVPYIAFNYLGQLVSGTGDEYIPLARGAAMYSRDPGTKYATANLPRIYEDPPGNGSNIINIIHIDRNTGRARLIQQEPQ